MLNGQSIGRWCESQMELSWVKLRIPIFRNVYNSHTFSLSINTQSTSCGKYSEECLDLKK